MKTSNLQRFGLASALLLGAGLLSGGCDDRAATAILVAISSEVAVPEGIDAITLSIESGSEVRFRERYQVDVGTGRVRLPGSITVAPRNDDAVNERVRVELMAEVRGIQVVLRSASMGFQEERQKLLRLVMRYSCYDVAEVCDAGQTCIGGTCQADTVEVETLPDAPPLEDVFVSRDSGIACFDARDTACAAGREMLQDLEAFKDADCTFKPSLPAGAAASQLNIFAYWSRSKDRAHPTVLEAHSPEGWFVPEKAEEGTIRFAPGMCKAVRDGRITRIAYNFACPSKREETALCLPAEKDVVRGRFEDSACHACVYKPIECETKLDEAKKTAAGEAVLSCAFGCGYDGHYDTLEECSVVRDCFFDCFAPYLDCAETDCAPYAALEAWSVCLSSQASADCASVCEAENSSLCE